MRLRKALEAEYPYDVLLVHYKKEQLMARQLPKRLRATLVWAEWGPVPVQMRQGPGAWLYRDAAAQGRQDHGDLGRAPRSRWSGWASSPRRSR